MRKILLPLLLSLFATLSACGGGSSKGPSGPGPGPGITPPAGLSYSQPSVVYTLGVAISANSPSSSGGWITQYSVEPALPAGLSLDAATGVISGTPSTVSAPESYTITGSNSAGSITARVQIEVTAQTLAPESLEYSQASVIYTVNVPTGPNTPISTGGAIETYSIAPSLPEGLSLDANTGVIAGTPAQVSAPASYIVTGSNSAGSASAQIMIEVQAQVVAPASLQYTHTAPVYVVGVTIVPNGPKSTGGEITQYSVTPALPAGLSLNDATGVISGTPSAASASASYTVTGSNSAGSVTAQLTIEVQSQITAPASLQYTNAAPVYVAGQPITPNEPRSTGGEITQYSVSPALPAGLSLNPTTGFLSGTPSAVSAPANYTVTGSNSAGSVTAQLTIEVQSHITAPISLQYTQTAPVYTVGKVIPSNEPQSTGGEITQYSVAPALPAGLSLDPQSGIISGTPSAVSAPANYTITGSNSAGNVTTQITIEVQAQVIAPASLRYAEPAPVYTVNVAITPNGPQSTGGAITQYAVSPALPAGLSLNTQSGVISGTPSAVSASKSYTITGSNSAGSVTAQVTIEVRTAPVAPPGSLQYTSADVMYDYQQAIEPNLPQASGGVIAQYSVSPALPAGLSLHATTGVISGTPSIVSTPVSYTVTGSNSAGSVTAQVKIAVKRTLQGEWREAGSMKEARTDHTATRLQDGRVLVAGGFSNSSYLSSAELYDPADSSWKPARSMNGVRSSHTATLLPDGTVLVAGGSSGATTLSTAELYDPANDRWTPVDPMKSARSSHTSTLLPTGRVLVAGGLGGEFSAELYDSSSSSRWMDTRGLNDQRGSHTATLLLDGTILVAGGFGVGGSGRATAERYDIISNRWIPTPEMKFGRYLHSATRLLDGKVLLAAGISTGINLSTAELYDVAMNKWTTVASLKVSRRNHTATLLSDGTVLVVGGYGETGPLSTAEGYDPVLDSWIAPFDMNAARAQHTATLLLDGTVLVTGGRGTSSSSDAFLSSAERLH